MSDNILDRLHKAIGALAETTEEKPAAKPSVQKSEDLKLTRGQFVGFVVEQVEKAAKDTAPVRKARLAYLQKCVEIVKNWEGPTTGAMSIPMFKDPDQLQPTVEVQGQMPASDDQGSVSPNNFAMNDAPPAVAGPAGTTPPGGDLPPTVAGSSGFASLSEATFAKALGQIEASIAKAMGTPPATETKPEPAKVTKSTEDLLWPHDMNTPFGRGDVAKADAPEWGWDSEKSAAEQPTK